MTSQIETELAGAQTVLIRPEHLPLVGQLATTLIVAGSSAFIAAAAAAPTGVLVAGLQSIREFVGVDGAPDPALDQLVVAGLTNVVLHTGDVRTDLEAFDHTTALAEHLSLLGARSVKILSTGALGLDAALAARPASDRVRHLTALIKAATPLGKRRPTAGTSSPSKRPSIAPTVDFNAGVIYVTSSAGFQEPLVEASARRLETRRVFDDLRNPRGRNPQFLHTLEVGIMDASGHLRTHTVDDVPDADLANARFWLNQVPGGVNVAVSPEHATGKLVDAALRAHQADLVIEATTLMRTGFAQNAAGEWGYTTPSGLLLEDGSLSQEIRSQLPDGMSDVQMRDVSNDTLELKRAAAKNTLEMMRELSPRPNIWYGTFGPAVWALTGQGRGGAGIVPWAYGLKGSGKTVLTQGVCAHLSPAFSPSGRIMAAFDSTTAAISRVMEGLEGSFLFVDDGRKRTTSRAADTQAESIEALVRTGYAGGSARRAVSVYNQVSRTWAPGVPELSAPVIGVSAEILPTQEAASTLERIYPIPFDGVNIFASGDSRKFEDMADGGLPAQHWAHLAQWMLGRINDHGMDVWKKHVGDTLAICVQKLDALPVSKRVKNVAARVSCGMLIWAEFLRDTTVITGVEFSDLSDLVHATIADNAAWHGSVNVEPNDGPAFGTILNSLRAAVASGQAYNCLAADITGVAPSMKARLLGALATSRDGSGSQFLAMQPRDVLQILATEPRFRSLTESELGAAFKEVSLTDTPGKLWKTVTVAGIRTRTLAIPYSLFVGAADTEAETP